MDGNGGKGLLFTKMSPGFDNWRQEAQCSSTHSKSMQPYRSATEPRIVPEKNFGGITTLFVEGKRVEGLQKENEKRNLGVAEVDKSSTSNNIKEVHSFKFVLIEHIRDVLKPYWEQGNLSKDAYKIIMKKSIDKIIGSIVASKFPKTKSDHQKYLSASKSKILELIQGDECNLLLEKPMSMETTLNDFLSLNASILESVCLALLLGLQDLSVTCRVMSHPIWTSLNIKYP